MIKARFIRICVLILSVWLCCCAGREVDHQLYGVWRCAYADYKDAYFEIRPNTIIFGNAQEETEVGTIMGFKYKKMPNKTWLHCTVKYQNRTSLDYEFEFYFNTRDANTIFFKNQEKLVWRKEIIKRD